MTGQGTTASIRAKALELGFDAVAFGPPEIPARNRRRYEEFIAQGEHGTMRWMDDRLEPRQNPRALWPEVQTVIALGLNYGPPDDPLKRLQDRDRAVFSVYAEGTRDYHDVIKKRLKALGRWLVETHGGELKVFVDTAPVPEKALAEAAGIGWQGKHTNLVSTTHGSWLFLGVIYTTLALPHEAGPHPDRCGSCTRCLEICPTRAITAPGKLDARRCISYLTIEHEGPIPHEFRRLMGNRIYGCDDCLAVCPWNRFAQRTKEAEFQPPRPGLEDPRIADFLEMRTDSTFREFFRGSPVKRIGHRRFIRNVLIAAGNSGNPAHRPAIRRWRVTPDPIADEVIREAAEWAEEELS